MSFNVGTVGVVIVAAIILGYLYFRKRSDEKGKEEIKKFLESLRNDFENIIVNFIDNIDITSFDNLAIIEQQIIEDLVAILWDKAVSALEDYVTDPINKSLIKKFLTRDYVEQFTEEIFNEAKIQTKYTAKYNDAIVAANKEAILLEAGVTQKNEEIDKDIPVDFREVEEISPDRIINAEGEIIEQNLNPQHEEEIEEVDPEADISVEVIE